MLLDIRNTTGIKKGTPILPASPEETDFSSAGGFRRLTCFPHVAEGADADKRALLEFE
jgi:hypothetical protein